MTEQELNNRLAEILMSSEEEARLRQAQGGRRTGRQYRRMQRIRHDNRLLFLIQHTRYAPNIGYIIEDYKGKTTLPHAGSLLTKIPAKRYDSIWQPHIAEAILFQNLL